MREDLTLYFDQSFIVVGARGGGGGDGSEILGRELIGYSLLHEGQNFSSVLSTYIPPRLERATHLQPRRQFPLKLQPRTAPLPNPPPILPFRFLLLHVHSYPLRTTIIDPLDDGTIERRGEVRDPWEVEGEESGGDLEGVGGEGVEVF